MGRNERNIRLEATLKATDNHTLARKSMTISYNQYLQIMEVFDCIELVNTQDDQLDGMTRAERDRIIKEIR